MNSQFVKLLGFTNINLLIEANNKWHGYWVK